MVQLHIANTIADLVQGDVAEHLPLERIPLDGDVLGLGTTAGLDNGELVFLPDPETPNRSRVYKSQPHDGSALPLRPGPGLQHFPYVCFSDDATGLGHPVDAARLATLEGGLQDQVGQLIDQLCAEGHLAVAPIYGLRLLSDWKSLMITVSSKLCLGQRLRNTGLARQDPGGHAADAVGANLYAGLPHFLLSAEDPTTPADPIRWLGASLRWECCGFWDRDPAQGRVTLPDRQDHLHVHGCSTDLRFGGHLQHQHADSRLLALERLVIYPLGALHWMAADPAIEAVRYAESTLHFTVSNRGELDASDLDVVVVIDDRWSGHRHLRLPWLAAGERESFAMPLELPDGAHEIAVIVDPEGLILEQQATQANNRCVITVS